jgi:hypothetical protein
MKSAAFESTLSPAYSPELVQLPAFEWTCPFETNICRGKETLEAVDLCGVVADSVELRPIN